MQNREKIICEDHNSPTSSIPFLMMIASIASKEGRHVQTIYINGAYLNEDISKQEILMEIDPTMSAIIDQIDPTFGQFIRSDNDKMVVQLKKALS